MAAGSAGLVGRDLGGSFCCWFCSICWRKAPASGCVWAKAQGVRSVRATIKLNVNKGWQFFENITIFTLIKWCHRDL
jgi:hypothetical protein